MALATPPLPLLPVVTRLRIKGPNFHGTPLVAQVQFFFPIFFLSFFLHFSSLHCFFIL
jgi:hypothetical protein